MVNDDILTVLKNAVNNGESLENAVAIAVNSGYNQREVYDTAKFLGGGTISSLEPRAEEHLVMPAQKNILGMPKQSLKVEQIKNISPNESAQIKQAISPQNYLARPPQSTQQQVQQLYQQQPPKQPSIGQYSSSLQLPKSSQPLQPMSLSQQLNQIGPKKPNYTKEIILIIILLILIGILISTFIFKDAILKFFSGL